MRWSRGGALEQNERKPENCSRAPSSRSILMTNTLKDWKFFNVPESVFIFLYNLANFDELDMAFECSRAWFWIKCNIGWIPRLVWRFRRVFVVFKPIRKYSGSDNLKTSTWTPFFWMFLPIEYVFLYNFANFYENDMDFECLGA